MIFERMIKGSKYLSCSGWGIVENKTSREDAGFKSVISTGEADSGSYKIGIGIEDGSGKIVYTTTDSLLRVDATHHVLR